MINSTKKIAPTPLETQYRELRRLSPENGSPANSAANRKSARQDSSPEDIVTLSSKASRNETPAAKVKPSQPVTQAERRALLYGFSVYG